jgi:regulator of sirC expression with transglutaminase-like and TPR domain
MTDTLIALGLIDDEDVVLDEAALQLALLDHPDTDLLPYRARLDRMAEQIREHAQAAAAATDRAMSLGQVLGHEFDLVGDQQHYDDPANADLIQVLDRGRGLPISLSILYVGIARRLGWQAAVLDVPGHVLVLVGAEATPVIIDPFRRGDRVTPEDLAALVLAHRPALSAAVTHVGAMENRAVLVRLLLNQASRAEQAGQGRRALTLYIRMTMIAPSHEYGWCERARLEMADGDLQAARTSLIAVLEITRDADLRSKISKTLTTLPLH